MPTITGNNNIIIINSTITDSVIKHESTAQNKDSTKRESMIHMIEDFIERNNQSMLWLTHFAKNHLHLSFSDLSDLSCIDLANLQSTVEKYNS